MTAQHTLPLPASPTGVGLPGCWTLARDRAITLDPRLPGYLRVAHGALWATRSGPHIQGAANDWGDVVLRCGTRIRLTPGQQVVLESFPAAANEDACFSWEPDAPAHAPAADRGTPVLRWIHARLADTGGALFQWLQAGPGWPRQSQSSYAQARDQAWRTLYRLGINQP